MSSLTTPRTYTTIQRSGFGKIFFMYLKVSYAHSGSIYLIQNTVKTVILWIIITIYLFSNVIYSSDDKAEFSF